MIKRLLLIFTLLLVLSACGLSDIGSKNIMLEPFANIQTMKLYNSQQRKEIKLSKEQQVAVVAELNERFKSPWLSYIGRNVPSCLSLSITENGRSRGFDIYRGGGVEGDRNLASRSEIASDSILKKLYDEFGNCTY